MFTGISLTCLMLSGIFILFQNTPLTGFDKFLFFLLGSVGAGFGFFGFLSEKQRKGNFKVPLISGTIQFLSATYLAAAFLVL